MDIRLKADSSRIDAAASIMKRKPVPIVFVTGNGDPATLSAAARVRHAGLILKPFRPADLPDVVERAPAPGS